MTPGWRTSSPNNASAGGHEEQPWEGNNSRTTGADAAWERAANRGSVSTVAVRRLRRYIWELPVQVLHDADSRRPGLLHQPPKRLVLRAPSSRASWACRLPIRGNAIRQVFLRLDHAMRAHLTLLPSSTSVPSNKTTLPPSPPSPLPPL